MVKKRSKIDADSKENKVIDHKLLSQEEVKKMISSIADMRDKLCVWIMYESGCSLGELVGIRIKDINEKEIKINNPDTNEVRNVRISNLLAKKLSMYIQGNGLPEESHLFSTKKSNQISVKRVREIIQYYSQKAGFGRLSPQMFRYYHVIHAYMNGVYIDNISKQLGIKRYRVFQILEESNVEIEHNSYDNFLIKMEEQK